MKKIYLAGSCGKEERANMVNIAVHLRKSFDVYCPFELKIPNAWDMPQEEWAKKVFDADVKAIDASDIIVVISSGRESTAGTNWEQGYAYAKGKRVFVFQMTEKATSLMTYWGCDCFYNTAAEQIRERLTEVVEREEGRRIPCTTVLT